MKKPDIKNESHWITHQQDQERRGKQFKWTKQLKWTNPALWSLLTQHGAQKPKRTDPWWNDWAANNPTQGAKVFAQLDPSDLFMKSLKGMFGGARSVDS